MTGRVLIISPSLKVGGIEKALTVLANEFVRHNHLVFFIPCLPGAAHYRLDHRVTIVDHHLLYRSGIVQKIFFYWRLIRFLRANACEIKANAVLSFGDVFNPLVLLALWGTKNKIFISDRTSPNFKINSLAQFLKRVLYPSSAGFIAQSQRMAEHHQKKFNSKLNIRIIPNAINLVVPGNQLRRKSILYVGRLSWEKGVDRLIRAFALLNDKEWTLDIVGAGPQDKILQELVIALGCEQHVVFHGQQQNTVLYYQSSSIFVLPSHVEGFPNALCEAMSAGMACVCFESIPYETIIIPDQSGLVVKKDDIQDLARKIEFLIQHPDKRLVIGENARQLVQKFNSDDIATQYLNFMGLV